MSFNENLKEEDNFITEHKNHIDNMVESIKDEMNYLHEVDKPGSNIEEYTTNLDKLLTKEIETITNLKNRLNISSIFSVFVSTILKFIK